MIKRFSIVVYVFIMLFLSLKPVGPKLISIPYIYQLQHFFAYMIFVIVAACFANAKTSFYKYCAVILFFSGAIELIQPYFGRECSVWDFLANTIGISFGMFVVYVFRKIRWNLHQSLSNKLGIAW